MKFSFPSFKLRSDISEILIHVFFAGFILMTLDIHHGKDIQIFFVLATLFFSHALLFLPYLFKKDFVSYLSTTFSVIFIVFVFGFLTGGSFEEVAPVVILTLITSGGYGAVRWSIVNRLNMYASTANTKTAELQLLKSQINPHFIFNSLNILYATALEENSSKTAECIAKMSNLIRYMVEDNSKEYVSVHKEVKYLNDYIKLQLMRSSVEHDIDFNIDITYDNPIAPMILIPFVENAFKHGINPNEASTLFVNFISSQERIYFQLINSVDNNRIYSDFEKGFGIGIDNVEKRMQLIYPKKHKLSIGQENSVFIVELEIRQK